MKTGDTGGSGKKVLKKEIALIGERGGTKTSGVGTLSGRTTKKNSEKGRKIAAWRRKKYQSVKNGRKNRGRGKGDVGKKTEKKMTKKDVVKFFGEVMVLPYMHF